MYKTIETIPETLHTAAREDAADVIRRLLKEGASVNQRSGTGTTPLHELSMFLGRAEAADLLLRHGADPNARDSRGRTPLHYAAGTGNAALTALLLNFGADPNVQENWGEAPLHWAALEGQADVVKILLDHHAAPHCRDKHGETPTAWAVYENQSEVIALLRKAGRGTRHCPPPLKPAPLPAASSIQMIQAANVAKRLQQKPTR